MSDDAETRYSLLCRDCVGGRPVLSSTIVPIPERNKPFRGMGAMRCDQCGSPRWVLFTVSR